MSIQPSIIATLATRSAIHDLRILLASLEFWNADAPPTVYLSCDAAVGAIVQTYAYKGKLVIQESLTPYTDLNRAAMEKMPGVKYHNLFFDFVCEKMNLLEWVFATEPVATTNGVLFCDADICFLGPVFQIPATAAIAVSRHRIRDRDEALYGKYNAGMIWMKSPEMVVLWRDACAGSRFYEQLPIETVVDSLDPALVYQIPVTENYGWWRLWQGVSPAEELQRTWGMNRAKPGAGITVGGEPLGSVHTHFDEKRDAATVKYNEWVLGWLRRIAKAHEPTRRFLKHLKWV